MPPRRIHEMVEFLLRSSEIHDVIHRTPAETELGGFYRTMMADEEDQRVEILRRRISAQELYDLPDEIRMELLMLFRSWVRDNIALNFGRYRNVYLTYFEETPSFTHFGNDIRLEFKVGDDSSWRRRTAEQVTREYEQRLREEQIRMLMQQPRRTDYIIENPCAEIKMEQPKKKVEHFDKDLFEV